MQEAKKEYWNLVKKLNSSNKTKNFKTEMRFSILKKPSGFHELIAHTSEAQISLCCEFKIEQWQVSTIAEYTNLSHFIIKIIKCIKPEAYFLAHDMILAALFQTPD